MGEKLNLNNMFLVGKKVCLRGLKESDLDNIKKWLNDVDTTRLLFQGDVPPNLELMKEDYNNPIKNDKDIEFAIINKKNNLHIGWAGIYEINWISRKGELRFFLGDKKYRRKGLTTEAVSLLIEYAFNKLNLHRVYGGTNKENFGSVKIFKNLNFKSEGTFYEAYFRNGKYYDIVNFGLINKKH